VHPANTSTTAQNATATVTNGQASVSYSLPGGTAAPAAVAPVTTPTGGGPYPVADLGEQAPELKRLGQTVIDR
jgi:hypothetical protein